MLNEMIFSKAINIGYFYFEKSSKTQVRRLNEVSKRRLNRSKNLL